MFIQYDGEWIDNFLVRDHKLDFYTKLRIGDTKAINNRHAGLMFYCAFVYAYPHTTPQFLPSILVKLVERIHDPNPIGQLVAETVRAYSKSHHEVWQEQKNVFTEDELDIYLSFSSGASYFVQFKKKLLILIQVIIIFL